FALVLPMLRIRTATVELVVVFLAQIIRTARALTPPVEIAPLRIHPALIAHSGHIASSRCGSPRTGFRPGANARKNVRPALTHSLAVIIGNDPECIVMESDPRTALLLTQPVLQVRNDGI